METQDETRPLPATPGGDKPAAGTDDTEPVVDATRRPEAPAAGTAHRPTRPRHRAFIAAVAVVAVGFLAGAAVAFSGGGDQATEQTPKPEASLGTISPTTAVSPSSRATTTAPPVAAVGSPPAPVAPGTIETVPTTAAPPTTTPETTPTTG